MLSNLETRIKQLENKILSFTTNKNIFNKDHSFNGLIDFENIPTINGNPVTNNIFAQFESNIENTLSSNSYIHFTSSVFLNSSGFDLTEDSLGIIIPKNGYYSISYKIILLYVEGGSATTLNLNVNSTNIADTSVRINSQQFGCRNKVLLLNKGDILGITNESGLVSLDNTYEPGCQVFINFLAN